CESEQGIDRAVGDAVLQQEQHDRRVQDGPLPPWPGRAVSKRRPPFLATPVESRRRYLICSITIIDHNLKAALLARPAVLTWCPGSDVRMTLPHALLRTPEPKGDQQLYDSGVALDLRFL